MLSLLISRLSNNIHQIHQTIVVWNKPGFSPECVQRYEHGARNHFVLNSRFCPTSRPPPPNSFLIARFSRSTRYAICAFNRTSTLTESPKCFTSHVVHFTRGTLCPLS